MEVTSPKNIISAGRRTLDPLATNIEAPKVADRVDDDGPEDEEGQKGKEKETPAKSQLAYIEDEEEEGGSEEDDDEQDEDVTSEDDSEGEDDE